MSIVRGAPLIARNHALNELWAALEFGQKASHGHDSAGVAPQAVYEARCPSPRQGVAQKLDMSLSRVS